MVSFLPLQLLQSLIRRQKVVFKIEVSEVLAVEQVGGELLEAAAGQIHRVDPLGHHLDGGRNRKTREVRKRNQNLNKIISPTRGFTSAELPAPEGSDVIR